MRRSLAASVACLMLSILNGAACADETAKEAPPADNHLANVSAAVGRGLKIVQNAAKRYPEHRQCFSCHHQTLPLFAMQAADEAGHTIDAVIWKQQIDFTRESFQSRIDRLREGQSVGGRAITVAYGLWTLDIGRQPADDLAAALATWLAKNQQDDGRFKPQSNRPPLEESDITTTLLAAYYAPLYALPEDGERIAEVVDAARRWLAAAPCQSNEDRVMRLWSAVKLRGLDIDRQAALSDVLAAQRSDGGWPQLDSMTSDAYATGQTLWILLDSGLPPDAAASVRARDFLLSAQQDDGSWRVETRSKPVQQFFDNGDPHGKSQFISIAATSWSVAALARWQAAFAARQGLPRN